MRNAFSILLFLWILAACSYAFDEVTVDLAQTTEVQLTFRRQSTHNQIIKRNGQTVFEWTKLCDFNQLRSRFKKLDCGEGGLNLTVLLTGISEQDAGDYVCRQGAGAGPEEPGCGVTLVVKAAHEATSTVTPNPSGAPPDPSKARIAAIILGVILFIVIILLAIDIARCHFMKRGLLWRLVQ